MGEAGATEVNKSPDETTGSREANGINLSESVELIGRWSLDFCKGDQEQQEKVTSENVKTKKRKKNQASPEKVESEVNEALLCTNKVRPVVSQLHEWVIAVHQNGLDLVTFDLSDDSSKPSKVQGHKKPVTSLVVICDGEHVISGGQDCQLTVWKISQESEDGVKALRNTASADFDAVILGVRAHPSNKVVLLWLESNLLKLRHIHSLEVDEVSIEVQDSDIQCLTMNEDQIIYGTNKGHIYVWSYESAENPVFNFESGHEDASLVEVCKKKMASWTVKQKSASLWSLDTRQKLADLHLNHPPVHLSLFQEAGLLLIVNTQHQLLLYQIRNMPPTEVRRNELGRFDCPVLSLTHSPSCNDFYIVLESGSILHLDVVCDLTSCEDGSDEETGKGKQNDRKGSSSCQIL